MFSLVCEWHETASSWAETRRFWGRFKGMRCCPLSRTEAATATERDFCIPYRIPRSGFSHLGRSQRGGGGGSGCAALVLVFPCSILAPRRLR